ncbi:MAG: tetratricopeptide repeat protein [Nitrospirae bacterium]|nr:tetratricopeptide repeat protein [Nitrospirota bacterium]
MGSFKKALYMTGTLLIAVLLLFHGDAVLAENSTKKPTESEIRQSREHFEKGAALEEDGKLDEAIVEYRIAAKLSPDDPDIHFNLGLTYLKKKQNKEAIVEYKKVVELSPRDSDAYKLLGIAYIQEGDKKEAIRQWKNSLRINPDQPDVKEFIKMNE